MISKATRRFIVTNKLKQGLPLTEEQIQWQKELGITISAKEPKERNVRHTPKDKAKFAVEQRGGKKWMQKWIDWDDIAIPIGKRRVAYARYLMMVHGLKLAQAKSRSLKFIKE